jgi:hypothetical protein
MSRMKSAESVASFKEALSENKKVYLIWKMPNIRKNLYEPNELQQFCFVKMVMKVSDGFVYELSPRQ